MVPLLELEKYYSEAVNLFGTLNKTVEKKQLTIEKLKKVKFFSGNILFTVTGDEIKAFEINNAENTIQSEINFIDIIIEIAKLFTNKSEFISKLEESNEFPPSIVKNFYVKLIEAAEGGLKENLGKQKEQIQITDKEHRIRLVELQEEEIQLWDSLSEVVIEFQKNSFSPDIKEYPNSTLFVCLFILILTKKILVIINKNKNSSGSYSTYREQSGAPKALYRADSIKALYIFMINAQVPLDELESSIHKALSKELDFISELMQLINPRIYASKSKTYVQDLKSGGATLYLDPKLPEKVVSIFSKNNFSVGRVKEIVVMQESIFKKQISKSNTPEIAESEGKRHALLMILNLLNEFFINQPNFFENKVLPIVKNFWHSIKHRFKIYMTPGKVSPYYDGNGNKIESRSQIFFADDKLSSNVSLFLIRQEMEIGGVNITNNNLKKDLLKNIFILPNNTKKYKIPGLNNKFSPGEVRSKVIHNLIQFSKFVFPSVMIQYKYPNEIEVAHDPELAVLRNVNNNGLYLVTRDNTKVPINTTANDEDMVLALASIIAFKPLLENEVLVRKSIPIKGEGIGKLWRLFIPKEKVMYFTPDGVEVKKVG
tara:strand:+ start:5635 stop:7431 length:1797 start_codon:yes stop_codon:yes gene_type:complete